jgi:hypothetical protein
MSRGHVSGNLQAGVQPLQAFPSGQSLTGYAEHVYQEPEGEPPVETNSIRYWRDWAGLRNGQLELRLNNQRAPRVHGLGWGLDPDAGVWRPLRVDATGALVVAGGGPTPEPGPPTAQLGAWYRADDILQAGGSTVVAWPDRSGQGATLLATGGASPTLATNVASLGGQNALNLDGSQQLARSTPPGYVGGNSAYSLYVVHDPVLNGTTTDPSVVFGWGGTGVANCRLTMFQYKFGGNWVCGMESFAAGSGGRLIPNGGQIYNASLAHNALCAATVVTVNGAVLPDVDGAGGGPLAIPSPVPWVTLGHFPASTGPNGYKGKVAEILYYHKNHSASERAATLAYLSARYGIPV